MSSLYGIVLIFFMFLTGIIWLIDTLTAKKARQKTLERLLKNKKKPSKGIIEHLTMEPLYLEYSKSFFPLFLFIVVLRSFLWEPFQIPSASMKPTLTEGDFILVSKYAYGIQLPILNKKIIPIGLPHRGDVAVFRAPDTGVDYIKRVVGLPGDTITYTSEKEVYIKPYCSESQKNQCPEQYRVEKKRVSGKGYIDYNPSSGISQLNIEYRETLGGVEHGILNNPLRLHHTKEMSLDNAVFIVPKRSYFVLGDNRDNSTDSRFWNTTHFVPEENLVGKAVMIWIHFDFGLINQNFYGFPLGWIPTNIDFNRIGRIR
jgi:signal peptidase I